MRAAVHKMGVVFQFGTQQRSDLYFRRACELALNGRLGKLKEIHVSVPGGHESELLPEQPLPDYVDWDRWMGPARTTPFHENKLIREWHENMTTFSLGFIACWGIHHLDIAQWGNGTQALCDIDTAVRSDTLCQIALIAVKQGRKLTWDPKAEHFVGDDAANAMLQPRPFRNGLKLQDVS